MKNIIASFALLFISAAILIMALNLNIDPFDAIIGSKYGIRFGDLKPKCDKKDLNLYKDLVKLKSQEAEIRAELTGVLIDKARAMGQISDNEAQQWIQINCLANTSLINISKVTIDKAQICVDPNQRLQGAQIQTAKKDLLEGLCWLVSITAKFVYMNVTNVE